MLGDSCSALSNHLSIIYSNVVPISLEHDGYAAASKTVEMGLTPISDTKFFIGEVIMKGMNA